MEPFKFQAPNQKPSNPAFEWTDSVHDIASSLVLRKDRERAKKLVDEARKDLLMIEENRNRLIAEHDVWDAKIKEMDHFLAWSRNRPSRIEKPVRPAWLSLAKAARENHLLGMTTEDCGEVSRWLSGLESPQVFLIEHDWAAAFTGAVDFNDGDFPLPFDHCIFDFQFLGKHVLMLVKQGEKESLIAFQSKPNWLVSDVGSFGPPPTDDDEYAEMYGKMYLTVRSLCIALDAQVAESVVIREPSNGRHSPPLPQVTGNGYHVVHLSRRTRAPDAQVVEAGHRKRLHFRRGHWRHYSTFKSWVRWCLVGDPDLGFIDKEYRA